MRLTYVVVIVLAIIAGFTAPAAATTPMAVEMVTVELPEMDGADESFDDMVTVYATSLIRAGFTATPDDGCECLTGPANVARSLTSIYTDTDGILFGRVS